MRKTITITKHSKWAQIAPFWSCIGSDARKSIVAKVQQYYHINYWEMTIEQLFKVVDGEPLIHIDDSAFATLFYEGLREWADQFTSIIKNYTAQEVSNAPIKFTFKEAVILELKEYFHLHNYSDTFRLLVADYVLMRKAQYAKYLTDKEMLKKYNNANKHNRHR